MGKQKREEVTAGGRHESPPAGGGEAFRDVAPGREGAYEAGCVGPGQCGPAEEEGRAMAVPYIQVQTG